MNARQFMLSKYLIGSNGANSVDMPKLFGRFCAFPGKTCMWNKYAISSSWCMVCDSKVKFRVACKPPW